MKISFTEEHLRQSSKVMGEGFASAVKRASSRKFSYEIESAILSVIKSEHQPDPIPAPPVSRFADFFDSVFVINLARRADRLDMFTRHLREIGWPFKKPVIMSGVDGFTNKAPAHWPSTNGTWWNLQSHIDCLQKALEDGAERVLILEDDVFFLPGFRQRISAFLESAPDDWDALMLGGRLTPDGGREAISTGIDRVWGMNNIEATAYHARFIPRILGEYQRGHQHSDEILNKTMMTARVYSAFPAIATQRAGQSDNFPRLRTGSWTAPLPGDKEGVVILSTGSKRRFLLANAAASVGRTCPGLGLRLFTDKPMVGYDTVAVPSLTGVNSRKLKTAMLEQSPWEISIFIDDDCLILKALPPLDDILGDADIALSVDHCFPTMGDALQLWQTGWGTRREAETTRDEYPECGDVPHYNSGVIIWRKNERTKMLSALWQAEWARFKSVDQLALFRALRRHPNIRLRELHERYHYREGMGDAKTKPAIVHLIGSKWNLREWLTARDMPVVEP